MQTAIAPKAKKTIRVTSRQINEVANIIKDDYPMHSKEYARQAVEVATVNNGFIDIVANSTLASFIKNL